MLRRGFGWGALTLAVAGLISAHPSSARAQELCLEADAPPLTAAPIPLRFGITPQLAGSVGATQGEVAPEDPARALEALHGLEPPRRTLVMRLNRLFMSDGQAGIDHFAALAEQYRREGFEVESQIRYHPTPEQEGDMAAWERFVRDATATLAPNPALVALTITNEVNLPISENTSDGAYEGALDAIVVGIVAAQEQLVGMGREDVALGFSYAYRYFPDQDLAFWRDICAYSGTLNVPDYRYFNLRDNRSDGGDLFDAVGLLFDDYAEKPAFSAYRDLIEACGQVEPGAGNGLHLRLRLRCRGDELRAKLKGADTGLVHRAAFRSRGDRLALDRRAPFARTLEAAEFGAAPRWKVIARMVLHDRRRAKLRRSKRPCD
jgi:hypothetical protein